MEALVPCGLESQISTVSTYHRDLCPLTLQVKNYR